MKIQSPQTNARREVRPNDEIGDSTPYMDICPYTYLGKYLAPWVCFAALESKYPLNFGRSGECWNGNKLDHSYPVDQLAHGVRGSKPPA